MKQSSVLKYVNVTRPASVNKMKKVDTHAINWLLKNMITFMLVADYLTPWSRVLPEKLRDPQLVDKFLALYGT
jgi:hypothetical protein